MCEKSKYSHVQYGPWHCITSCLAVGMLCIWAFFEHDWVSLLIVFGIVALLFAFSLYSCSLTIRDEGDGLFIKFGSKIIPSYLIPSFLWGKIDYSIIESVEPSRMPLTGWGMQVFATNKPFCRIWGRKGVKILMKNGATLRLGSNDAENLLVFLRDKLQHVDKNINV